jgi:hypothetical protein
MKDFIKIIFVVIYFFLFSVPLAITIYSSVCIIYFIKSNVRKAYVSKIKSKCTIK